MEEGLGPGVVAVFGELSQEKEEELGLQSLVVVGPAVVLDDIWGLASKEWESLVPAYLRKFEYYLRPIQRKDF